MPVFIEGVLHQRHELAGERFQRVVIVDGVFQRDRRYGEHDTLGSETSSGENVVAQEAVDSAIAVLERVQENESIGNDRG